LDTIKTFLKQLAMPFKIYNGSNDIEGIITPERMMPYRIKFRHRYIHKNHSWVSIGTQNSSLPHNAAMVKGSAYGIFSRSFIRFVIENLFSFGHNKNVFKAVGYAIQGYM
jgi:hypothetical protein